MTSDHRLVKTHIAHLSTSLLSSPAWSTRSNLITSTLQRLYTPSFSDPRPCLTRAPSWKTLWGEISTQDPEDGRWWAPLDAGKIPMDVHTAAEETLRELRDGLGLFFRTTMAGKGYDVWVPEESLNPFESRSDEITWEILRPDETSSSSAGSVVVRLKLALRWTDDTFKRYRVKYISREFPIDLPQMQTIRLRPDGVSTDMTTRALRGMGGKEFEHVEYAHIPYHHQHSSSITLSLSDQTLVGSSYEGSLKKEKEKEVSEGEVKAWAAQFEKKQTRRIRWSKAKKGVVVK